MRPREINCLRHPITSRQALGMLIDCWTEDRQAPVMLITARGDTLDMVSRIRASLSKERQLLAVRGSDNPMSYGFIVSEPFPCRVTDRQGEAIVIRYRVTISQSIMNSADFIFGRTQI